MKRVIVQYQSGFQVIVQNQRSQAAVMVIEAGKSEGGPDNQHKGADQWLYVESGTGRAIINGHAYEIGARALVLIERGDTHEIRNTGSEPLKTLSIYVPPAYDADGNERPAGQKD